MDVKPVTLTEAEAAQLRDLNEKAIGLQRGMQMFVETAERRGAELQRLTEDAYRELATKYNLDLQHVVYALGRDGKTLVPMQQRFDQ